jgi:hypothetical protein
LKRLASVRDGVALDGREHGPRTIASWLFDDCPFRKRRSLVRHMRSISKIGRSSEVEVDGADSNVEAPEQ